MSKKLSFKSICATCMIATVAATGVINIYGHNEDLTKIESIVSDQERETAYNTQYLSLYFDIQEIPQQMTAASFHEALSTVSMRQVEETGENGSQATLNTDISYLEAIALAVRYAGFEELVHTYTPELVATKRITLEGVHGQYMACALDTGLIDTSNLDKFQTSEPIQKEDTINLLMAVAEVTGNASHFIGYTNDSSIYGRIIDTFNEANLYRNETLQSIGAQAVMDEVVTGYNIIHSKHSANFIPDLTLRYGHSSIEHATQLIALLNREGLVAKVQIEPKTSTFKRLPEWGPVGEPTAYSYVEVINEDLMLQNDLEFDLVLEFTSVEEKETFNRHIEAYAKKNDVNLGEGLLLDSWWQPLYVSAVSMEEGYSLIYNNTVEDGDYILNSFSLESDKDIVLERLQALDTTVEVNQVPMWCNDAFYRYLTGTSHQ